MNGDAWKPRKPVFATATQPFAHGVLWLVVGFAWCIRRTFIPLGKTAAQVEAWALTKLGERAD